MPVDPVAPSDPVTPSDPPPRASLGAPEPALKPGPRHSRQVLSDERVAIEGEESEARGAGQGVGDDPDGPVADGRARMNRARGMRSGTLRWAWATLTSMRTALALLLLLGLAAIPGSLLPQRPTSPFGVAQYLLDNPEWGPWLERLGLFDVFGSPWFAAVYLLLFVSLIGCILPRCRAYYDALRAEPGALPRRFSRFPDHAAGAVGLPADQVLDDAEAHLRQAGYRIRREASGISAEKGYLREAGNLIFHLSLIAVLIGLAWGTVFGYRGSAIVVEGKAFSNTLTQYDEFSAGIGFRPENLPAFTIALDAFEAEFEIGPVQRGAARLFRATVTVSRPGQEPQRQLLEVNAPLTIDGTDVHLLGHGYAPVVTVRDGNGEVAFSGPVVFLPADANFTSNGVIKAPDARPERLAFEGLFLPTAQIDEAGMRSVFPDAWNPQLLVNAWAGPPRVETGAPENIYVLDQTGLEQLMRPDGQPVRAGLEIGTSYDLPDGRGSISFDGLQRWTKLQISTTPGGWFVLGSVLLAIAGLSVSLTVRPRRLFVRVAGDSVEVAGLDRVDGRAGLPEAVAALAAACGIAGPGGGTPGEPEPVDGHPAGTLAADQTDMLPEPGSSRTRGAGSGDPTPGRTSPEPREGSGGRPENAEEESE